MKVRVEAMPSMWVASCRAVGVSPEVEVWNRLHRWAEAAGLLEDPEGYPVFGLYPEGHPDSDPEHRYELWIRVDEEMDLPDGMLKREFEGGLYAVTDWSAASGREVAQRWEELEGWVQTSEYGFGEHQRLEKLTNVGNNGGPRELYLPVVR